MLRILVPVDGSENSLRAVEQLAKKLDWYREAPEIHLLNVQHALPSDVSRFVSRDDINQFHHDEGIKALEAARAALTAKGLKHDIHISVGDPAETIVHYVRDKKIDQIVMGTRGLSSIGNLLLGSVTTKVIHLADVPVLLIK
jgi:nucleotide-binding universal stress UspA family protein